MEEKAAVGLKDARLDCGRIRSFGTPRRLALMVDGLAAMQKEST